MKKEIKKVGLLGSWARKAAFGMVVFEIGLFSTSYYFYWKINRNQWFRFEVYKRVPFILNWYYSLGEKLGGLDTRQRDLEYFNLRLGQHQQSESTK